MRFEIVTLATLSDNYNFLLHDTETGQTALIDAPEDPALEQALKARGWSLDMILLTHHHWDHADGARALADRFGAKIVGASADAHRLPALDVSLRPGDSFQFASAEVQVIDVPGHTVGHIAYYIPAAEALFSGDSLMALGCGRLFEGSPNQMYASLSRLAELPAQTLVYSGHEYSAANARFALTIETENEALKTRADKIAKDRAEGRATVPSLLSDELATNPYLRCTAPAIQKALVMQGAAPEQIFAEIRSRKDNF